VADHLTPGTHTNPLNRHVGESYKDYAERMAGHARACQLDRDQAQQDLLVLDAQREDAVNRLFALEQQRDAVLAICDREDRATRTSAGYGITCAIRDALGQT
jgi:hypothetical protein